MNKGNLVTPRQGQPGPLESRVLSLVREHNLLAGQQCLLVAVSGGQDSVCLLHILAKLQTELNVKLHLAHLNHQLRGSESESDAQYVAYLAHKMTISATIEKRDVRAYRIQHRLSLEEAAREVRYTFLSEVAQSVGTDRVAVAHTTDDHIETILMHLIRGSGTRGLRGLQPSSLWCSSDKSLVITRPLLRINHKETAAYCQSHQLMPQTDTSNLSLSPLRNRIRLKLLPLLQNHNPRIGDALQRTSRLAGETLAFLDKECIRSWDRIVRQQWEVFLFDKAEFLKLPTILQRHLLRLAIERILGNLTDIESRHIEQIMAALTKPAGKKLNLPEGLTFTIDYNHYLLARDAVALYPLPPLEGETKLKIAGETHLPGWRITTAVTPLSTYHPSGVGRQKSRRAKDQTNHHKRREADNNLTAYLDFDKTGGELTVRRRQTGDCFQPLGLKQPKKLGRFMSDAKIPQSWRQRVPIIDSPQHVVWIVGWRIDERVKITEATKKILCLEFERTDGSDEG